MNLYITRNNMQVQFIRFRKKYRLYSGDVLFNAISLIHVLRSDTFKAERIIGRFEHNSLDRLAAAIGCMSSRENIKIEDLKKNTAASALFTVRIENDP